MDRLWADLAGPDAVRASQALAAFGRTSEKTVAFIAVHLPPELTPSAREVERWIGDLNSERFAVREKASRQLEMLGGMAEPAMRKALKSNLSLEVRQRVDKLVEKLSGPLTLPGHLRAVRAVEILEHIGGVAARSLLSKYAAGAPGACLTRDAGAALARLEKPPAGSSAKFAPDDRSRTDVYRDPLPAGAVARLGTIRFRRHSEGLTDLAFLPDGKTIVTAGGHAVQFWDAENGRLRREISTEPVSISAFALTADAKHFAIVGLHPHGGANVTPPGEIRVYTLNSGKLVTAFSRDGRDTYQSHLALSPDGKRVFSLGGNGTLRIEDIASGKEVLQKQFPRDNSAQLALSPDGRHLAVSTGVNTHKFFLWEWQGKEPRELTVPRYGAHWVNFSRDSKLVAAVGYFQEGLRVWDVASGQLLYHIEPRDEDLHYYGRPVFTPDGKTLVLCLNHRRLLAGKTELLDPVTGARQGLLDDASSTMSISADSRRLALASGRGVHIVDLLSRKELGPNYEGHSGNPTHIIVSPKGFVATAGDDNSVRVWDAGSSRQKKKFSVNAWVRDIAVSPDGKLLAGSSFDDLVHVWDPENGREIYRLAGHGQMGGRRMLRFLPDSKGLLSFGDDFYLRLCDMKTGKARFEHAIRPSGVTIPDGDGNDRRKDEFLLRLGEAVVPPAAGTFVLDIAGDYHVFDMKSGKEKRKFPSADSIATHTAVSPDGKRLLASAWGAYQIKNHPVMLLDAATGKVVQRWVLPSSVGGPVAFSADGRVFATAVEEPNRQILVYEIASGKVRHTVQGYRGRVWSLAFFPDGRRLASGQSDSTVLI